MKLLNIIFVFLFFCIPTQFMGQNDLPIRTNNSELNPLGTLLNSAIQLNLENEINLNPAWKNLIQQKRMAVGIIDLSNIHKVTYVRVNSNEMMHAASLPKTAILLTAMDAIEKTRFKSKT